MSKLLQWLDNGPCRLLSDRALVSLARSLQQLEVRTDRKKNAAAVGILQLQQLMVYCLVDGFDGILQQLLEGLHQLTENCSSCLDSTIADGVLQQLYEGLLLLTVYCSSC